MAIGTLQARAVISGAQTVLNDLQGVSWGFDELLRWLNAGQRQVVLLRPDASSELTIVDLDPGTTQSLPAGSMRLLDIDCNVNGSACTYLDKSAMDSFDRTWRTAAANAAVMHWMYDERAPQMFEVYPPQPLSQRGAVKILRSVLPPDCTLLNVSGGSEDSVIGIPDQYEGALIDYCVYRCYSKDAEYTVRGGKAEMAYEKFLQSLGIQLTTDRRFGPRANVPPQASQMQPTQGAFP
jgi:hypothetical protein